MTKHASDNTVMFATLSFLSTVLAAYISSTLLLHEYAMHNYKKKKVEFCNCNYSRYLIHPKYFNYTHVSKVTAYLFYCMITETHIGVEQPLVTF